MTTFTYIELFAGIGGFRQALDKIGGQCVFASEIDKFAQQSYTALYGGDHLHGDITKIEAQDIPDHDVIVAGIPCQAFSVAGKRRGFEDTRGTLFFDVARIAAEKKPKAIWIENVKGLVGHDRGKTLDTIVQTLNDIGYHVDFNVLNSKYFGVPQNRERIFIVALRDDLAQPAHWIIEGNNVVAKGKRRISGYDNVKTFNFAWPAQIDVTVRLRDVLETQVDEKYYLSEDKTAALVAQLRDKETNILNNRKDNDINPIYTPDMLTKNQNGTRIKPSNDVAPALTVQDRHGIIEGLPIREATKQGYTVAAVGDAVGDAVNFQFPDSNTRRGRVGKQIANTLEASGINQGVVEGFNTLEDGTTYAVTTRTHACYLPRHVAKKQATLIEQSSPRYRIRKLTPLECWRLQGFSDVAHDAVADVGISDSQRYKQAGNAVTVNVIEAIGKRLIPLIIPQA